MIFHCSFRHICTTHIPAGVKGVADGSLNTQLTVPRNDKHKSSETVVTGRPFLRPQKVKHLFHAAIRSYFQQFKGKKRNLVTRETCFTEAAKVRTGHSRKAAITALAAPLLKPAHSNRMDHYDTCETPAQVGKIHPLAFNGTL